LEGGAAALGAGPPQLAAEAAADFVSLDATHPSLAGKSGDAILDAWIFANGTTVDCMWVHGKKVVEGGRHKRRDAIARRFSAVMQELST
ncbi:MAG: formimidoylglutamate deiminase, partial [Mesorhizobium sp.]